MYLILSEIFSRYCQDKYWRSFAHYGTYPECVKEYKTKSGAIRQAKRIKSANYVAFIPANIIINASGDCYSEIPGEKPDTIVTVYHKLTDFIVWDKTKELNHDCPTSRKSHGYYPRTSQNT